MTAGTGIITGFSSCKSNQEKLDKEPIADNLRLMITDIVPIWIKEREARIEKAQWLLVEQKMVALVLYDSTSLEYFTGISWWPVERVMVAIIPAKGEVKYVCPGF